MVRTIIGIIAVTEKVALEAEREQTSMFFSQLFEKQLGRQRAMLDAFVVSPTINYQLGRQLTIRESRCESSMVLKPASGGKALHSSSDISQ
jgi:hypothetical protein